ncbi:PilW family protein [Variovorax sp. J22P168]|uniref:PilW family protein n=1 Tax=Variovorax jilinensis TaxID=3053513 RepID=UPI002575CC73|nr:PilW family protein [Variovorax sp. J22P168]MDM0014129.1 PilW family protein [Variovorax sp. J22P168]
MPHLASQRGLTLVELLVAMVIGLVVTLAVTSVVVMGEQHKRTTTGTNDANQSGNYLAYVFDRAIRSAGSGFAQAWNLGAFGCTLIVDRNGKQILPRADAFPAPFASVPQTLQLAPLLIDRPAEGSDVVIAMSGNAASGDIGRPIRSSAGADNVLRMSNTIGLSEGDIGIISREGVADCLIEQVKGDGAVFADAVGNETLPLGGLYYSTGSEAHSLTDLIDGGGAYFTTLGRAGANNVQFQMFSVNTSHALVSYDLMLTSGAVADPVADLDKKNQQMVSDGVIEMRALYGIDSTGDGVFDSWVAPSGEYAIDKMMASPAKMRQVIAVRVAMVVRSGTFEKEPISPEGIVLFGDLAEALHITVPIDDTGKHFRHRVVETTIPLRNMLLLPPS